jgi:tetratricopeptide (TPR) repeat protein
MTRNCGAVAVLATIAAAVCGAPLRAQIDFSTLDKYRGLDNQRPSNGNSGQSGTQSQSQSQNQSESQSSAQTSQDKSRATAFASNERGRAACAKGDWATAEAEFKKALKANPSDPVYRRNIAIAQDQEGSAAFRSGDYPTAANYFRQALANTTQGDPFHQDLQDNVSAAESRQAAAVQERKQRQQDQQDKIAASKMRQDIQNLAQSLTAAPGVAPSSGNLDFMSSAPKPHARNAAPALAFDDPMVVNAQNVPTGLPDSVAAQIPDTPAGNRIRKGFEAITEHDWNVAHAWFQDALNHDPGNAGIERLIELSEYTMDRESHPLPLARPRTAPPDTGAPDTAAAAAIGANVNRGMDPDLAKAFEGFNRNYLTEHPGVTKPPQAKDVSPTPAKPMEANWKAFFDAIFVQPPKTYSVSGVRD